MAFTAVGFFVVGATIGSIVALLAVAAGRKLETGSEKRRTERQWRLEKSLHGSI